MSILRKLVAEPLVQFLAIGLVIFGIDRMTAEETADPREIRVDEAVYTRLAGIFYEIEDRLPGSEDMDRMVDRYVINETLFREARALELDHGDEMMRERLVQRMRRIIYSGIEVETPEEDILRAWVADQPGRYILPAKVSFRVLGIDATEEDARAMAAQTQAREDAGETVKPEGVRMLSLIDRPRPQLVAAFEEAFIAAIEAAPKDKWTAVPSVRGWQVVKLLDTKPAHEPEFEDIRKRASGDWREWETQRRARGTLDSLMASYPVARDPFDPAMLDGLVAARASEPAQQ